MGAAAPTTMSCALVHHWVEQNSSLYHFSLFVLNGKTMNWNKLSWILFFCLLHQNHWECEGQVLIQTLKEERWTKVSNMIWFSIFVQAPMHSGMENCHCTEISIYHPNAHFIKTMILYEKMEVQQISGFVSAPMYNGIKDPSLCWNIIKICIHIKTVIFS